MQSFSSVHISTIIDVPHYKTHEASKWAKEKCPSFLGIISTTEVRNNTMVHIDNFAFTVQEECTWFELTWG